MRQPVGFLVLIILAAFTGSCAQCGPSTVARDTGHLDATATVAARVLSLRAPFTHAENTWIGLHPDGRSMLLDEVEDPDVHHRYHGTWIEQGEWLVLLLRRVEHWRFTQDYESDPPRPSEVQRIDPVKVIVLRRLEDALSTESGLDWAKPSYRWNDEGLMPKTVQDWERRFQERGPRR